MTSLEGPQSGPVAPDLGTTGNSAESLNMKLAISRSRVRKSVLFSLASERVAYPTIISRSTHIGVANVIGALVGSKGRFSRALSLVGLGLATEEKERADHRIRVFHITPKGLEIVKRLDHTDRPP